MYICAIPPRADPVRALAIPPAALRARIPSGGHLCWTGACSRLALAVASLSAQRLAQKQKKKTKTTTNKTKQKKIIRGFVPCSRLLAWNLPRRFQVTMYTAPISSCAARASGACPSVPDAAVPRPTGPHACRPRCRTTPAPSSTSRFTHLRLTAARNGLRRPGPPQNTRRGYAPPGAGPPPGVPEHRRRRGNDGACKRDQESNEMAPPSSR